MSKRYHIPKRKHKWNKILRAKRIQTLKNKRKKYPDKVKKILEVETQIKKLGMTFNFSTSIFKGIIE